MCWCSLKNFLIIMEKCTMINLLHWTDICKRILIENIESRNERWWVYKEIQTICKRLDIEPAEVCYYSDKTKNRLKEKYFEMNEIEEDIIREIKALLENYNFKNKKKLADLIKIEIN